MGKLDELGIKYNTDKASPSHNYLDFYEEHIPKDAKRVLEIGTYHGGSLRMWRDFYPDAEIVGVDLSEPWGVEGVTEVHIDARDVYALKKLGKFDLIVDDGSHRMLDQQIFMQYALANMLEDEGVFIMEDIHTSFSEDWQDTARQTTVEVLKELEDEFDITYSEHENKEQDYTAIIRKKK